MYNEKEKVQYGRAFVELKKAVFKAVPRFINTLVTFENDHTVIRLPNNGSLERRAAVYVEVDATHDSYGYRKGGARIHFKGYGMGYNTSFKKYLNTKYDDKAEVWTFNASQLKTKTKEAVEYAMGVYDARVKYNAKNVSIKENVVRGFCEFVDPDLDDLDQKVQVYNNRVDLDTDFGEVNLHTEDGITYRLTSIDIRGTDKLMNAADVKAMVAQIAEVVGNGD